VKVRALTGFVSEAGTHEPGDIIEMADSVAQVRIAGGLVAPFVGRQPVEEAVTPEPERAVSRPKRPRK